MVNIQRLRTTWNGFPGGPGVTTMYAQSGEALKGAWSIFLGAISAHLPADVTAQIDTSGDIIDVLSGDITGTWTGGTPSPHVGSGSGNYSAPSGYVVRWETGDVVRGRHVRGHTYIVPASADVYDLNGSISFGWLDEVNPLVSAMIAATPLNMVVYQRPRPATPSWTDVRGRSHAARVAVAGGFSTIVSGSVPDKAVVLRSRRD